MKNLKKKNQKIEKVNMENEIIEMKQEHRGMEKNEAGLKTFHDFLKEEDGMGTVELILIIVVLIGLVIIFKEQLRNLVEKVFEKITSDSNSVMS